MSGLYIHIPFCKKKCDYCDFCSYTDKSDKDFFEYANCVSREIELTPFDGEKIDTVYVGGGTPSLLPEGALKIIIDAARNKFDFCPIEFTAEANPESLSNDKLAEYKTLGITRVSIGVQSFNDNELKSAGRIHNAEQAKDSVKRAVNYDFDVSADFIIGLYSQTKQSAVDTITGLIDLGVKHISAYGLSVEKGTKLYNNVQNGMILLDDDAQTDIYDEISDILEEHGYNRYEISNFAKAGYECKHNMGYWQRIPYIGVGVAAHGFTGSERYSNVYKLDDYYNLISNNKLPRSHKRKLTISESEFESIMLALRTTKGLDLKRFSREYNSDFIEKYSEQLNKYNKMLCVSNNRIFVLPEYFYVLNSILVDFISD